ncbi:hypothetical protein [Shimazuella kribbensis]|uniref:hypothetical protein n=1 Tax=Shimazuella kribbensis TaxID=139808 RepID=UPI00048C4200|nr:hypothetical protein [Shimazuella kribbensis]
MEGKLVAVIDGPDINKSVAECAFACGELEAEINFIREAFEKAVLCLPLFLIPLITKLELERLAQVHKLARMLESVPEHLRPEFKAIWHYGIVYTTWRKHLPFAYQTTSDEWLKIQMSALRTSESFRQAQENLGIKFP